jgi:acyl-CoA synthetase (AMP-forming)/AMP-acid ligase II/aryl carrier-like protein
MVLPNGPSAAAAFTSIAASATCAPLNPSYKLSEFEFYLKDLDANALIVLIDSASPSVEAAERLGIPVLKLAPDVKTGAGAFDISNLDKPIPELPVAHEWSGPEDVGLVLHTSGTTARPKIVPLTHTNLCTSGWNVAHSLNLQSEDCCLNIMPLFHIHGLIGAVLASLSAGAAIYCTAGFSAPDFFTWLRSHKPTWYTSVPTMHQAILVRMEQERISPSDVAGVLRLVRSSSASLPPQVMASLETLFGVPVLEAYGMTEAAHQMACNPLPPAPRKRGSVGPAAGPEIQILGPDGALAAPAIIGEVVIRGRNVTPGYAGNPAANEAAFKDGWFRTGDQGYLDEDKYLFLTGRIKELINRGGEKISPREIDEALLEYPGVIQAVAFGVPDERLGEAVFAAVIRSTGLKERDEETLQLDIREFVSNRLADFKVPERIVFLDDIPKGPTGKVQRIGLASALGITSSSAHPPVKSSDVVSAASNDLSKIQASTLEICRELLRRDDISIGDDFFRVGGDSLLAARLMNRLEQSTGARLTLIRLFATPTIEGLANALVQAMNDTDNPGSHNTKTDKPPPVQVQKSRGSFVLSSVQQRLWFLYQWEPESPLYNSPILIRITGNLNIEGLSRALNALIVRHETLRTSFQWESDTAVQKPIAPYAVNLHIVGDNDNDWQQREARHFIDLESGMLLRAVLKPLSDAEHLLLIVVPHIVSDGWSRNLLQRDLFELYKAFSLGQEPVLPELPFQYGDYAVWQQARLASATGQQHLDYWKKRLRHSPTICSLTPDRPRSQLADSAGRTLPLRIPAELRRNLEALAQASGATLFMALTATLQTLIHRETGQTDIVIGTPVAGRRPVETENLIGCFINTLVLRTDLADSPSFNEVLARVRTTCLEAYDHQDLPFEKLVEELRPQRDPGRSPLIQIMIVLHNTPPLKTAAELIVFQSEPVDTGTSKFDLTLNLNLVGDGIQGSLEFRSELFDTSTIERFAQSFAILAQSIVESPDRSVEELNIDFSCH